LAVADVVGSPSAPPPAVPSPLKSPPVMKSPAAAPLLPPEGLPTAPPPDKIKPIEPRGGPAVPKADPAAASAQADDLDYRYLAVIEGDCDELVVGDHALPACAGKLVNVDFGNGRVAFMFTGQEGDTTVVTTFSGGVSAQPHPRAYELTIDRMSTTTLGADRGAATVVVAAAGNCTMRGDPTHEQSRFECRVRNAGKETSARFRTSGAPAVYAGSRGGSPDSVSNQSDGADEDPGDGAGDVRMPVAPMQLTLR
jgi:hypothetical protein